MIVGEPSYVKNIYRMALGSHGAISIQYLMALDGETVLEINDVMNQISREIKDGK